MQFLDLIYFSNSESFILFIMANFKVYLNEIVKDTKGLITYKNRSP